MNVVCSVCWGSETQSESIPGKSVEKSEGMKLKVVS